MSSKIQDILEIKKKIPMNEVYHFQSLCSVWYLFGKVKGNCNPGKGRTAKIKRSCHQKSCQSCQEFLLTTVPCFKALLL